MKIAGHAKATHGGAVACRIADGQPQFLLVTASGSNAEWVLPKGHMEKDETAERAALRELEEEAGYGGEIIGELGAAAFHVRDEFLRIRYFLVRVSARRVASEARQIAWLPGTEAIAKATYEEARHFLRKAARMVATNPARLRGSQ